MKYTNPQLQSLLAAEYVLGMMTVRTSRRFEQLREDMPALQREQAYWEQRLAALGLKLSPKIPSELVWARIEREIRARRTVTPSQQALTDRAGFWQVVAMAAAVATIVMGVLLRQAPGPAMPDYISIVQASESTAMWMVTADMKRGELRCKSMGEPYPLDTGKDLELWLLVKDEAAPISLGVLPKQGEMMMPLTPQLVAKLGRGAALAVSLEPAGGSTTGAPTGPVLFTAPPLVRT
jgi:anti-sigma-K factor RskA